MTTICVHSRAIPPQVCRVAGHLRSHPDAPSALHSGHVPGEWCDFLLLNTLHHHRAMVAENRQKLLTRPTRHDGSPSVCLARTSRSTEIDRNDRSDSVDGRFVVSAAEREISHRVHRRGPVRTHQQPHNETQRIRRLDPHHHHHHHGESEAVDPGTVSRVFGDRWNDAARSIRTPTVNSRLVLAVINIHSCEMSTKRGQSHLALPAQARPAALRAQGLGGGGAPSRRVL